MRQGYDAACDIWSLGVLLYTMLAGYKQKAFKYIYYCKLLLSFETCRYSGDFHHCVCDGTLKLDVHCVIVDLLFMCQVHTVC